MNQKSNNRLNNSYFMAEDKVNGWGNTTFFTYYSEFNRGSDENPYIEAAVLNILCMFSTVANLIIFMTLTCNRSLRTVTNFFICNLTVSDMLFTISGPFIGACRITQSWTMGEFACKSIVYMQLVCSTVSIWTMVMISVERFICIVRAARAVFTHRIAVIVIIVIWVVTLLFFLPAALYFRVMTFPFGNTTVDVCTIDWPKVRSIQLPLIFTVFVILIVFLAPFLLLTHNYIRIFWRFWNARNILKRTRVQYDPTWPKVSLHVRQMRDARDLKVVKILFSLVIIFTIMWMPIFTVFLYILIDIALNDMKLGSYIFIISICISMGNACINPILYGVMNEHLKTVLLSCIKPQPETDARQNVNNGQPTTIERPQRNLVKPCSIHGIQPIPEEPD
ncbi:hypothetical protein SNE40_007616 [Patella caerulea]|uniref:G-protein coupled receptors family 1 profile domain-containing protein n=1 Tax=Patella caerulea TaxID=87958 RepID=A0AAN8Q2K3_PATCE